MPLRATRRLVLLLGLLTGVVAVALLLVLHDVSSVLAAFARAGWGVILAIAVRVVAVSLAGLGWWCLLPRGAGSPPRIVGLRLVREGLNCLLPVGQVGGEVVGARLLALTGLGAGLAAATVLVDMLLQMFTQLVFAGIGFATLLAFAPHRPALLWIGLGLLVGVATVVAFLLAQRLGLFLLVERLSIRLSQFSGWQALGRIEHLHRGIQEIYRRRGRLAASTFLHLLAWALGTLEIWIVLRWMGYPVGIAEALVLESLVSAIRSAAFFLPGGLGAQEAGFVLLGSLLGLPPQAALALSLVKRIPELAIGVPALAAWHTVEARRAVRQTRSDRTT